MVKWCKMTRKQSNLEKRIRTFEWTRKRKINAVMFAVFIITFLVIIFAPLSWFLWGTTKIQYTDQGTISSAAFVDTSGNLVAPSVGYEYIATFTAIGSFSVNNPITVNIIIRNVSLPNFLNYYSKASFEYALNYPNTLNSDGTINSAAIPLKDAGKDPYLDSEKYTGTGVIIWMRSGDMHGTIVFPNTDILLSTDALAHYPIAITITGVSDTLTQTYTENTNKMTLSIGSFSILFLISVVEAIFLKEERTTLKNQAGMQQLQQQHKKVQ